MLHDNQASYEPDMAAAIDQEYEIIADELGVDIKTAKRVVLMKRKAVLEDQALLMGKVIGLLLQSKNQSVALYALAIAAGLDQLNGIRSETEVASMHGCTRALVSHYVVGWRDLLTGNGPGFDNTKYRKKNSTRKTYAKQATDPFKACKQKVQAQDAERRGKLAPGSKSCSGFDHPDFDNKFWH